MILPENLPARFRQKKANGINGAVTEMTPLEEAQKEQIAQTLRETSWNQSRAAEILGIDRKTLRMKIRRWGLQEEK